MKNKKFLFILLLLGSLIIVFAMFYKQSPADSRTSQILINGSSKAFIYDIDRNKISLIPKAQFAYGWSPSGKQLLYKNEEGLWVSRYDGDNPIKILDAVEHPQLNNGFPDAVWLTDRIVLVESRIKYGNSSLYSIDLQSDVVTEISPSGGALLTSPEGSYWLTQNKNVYLVTLDGTQKLIQELSNYSGLPIFLSGSSYRFSPDGTKLTYPVQANYPANAELWIGNISKDGLTNTRLLIDPKDCNTQFGGDVRWSPDGKFIGYYGYREEKSLFCVSNTETGKTDVIWPVQYTSGTFLWSPISNEVAIDNINALGVINLLDLSTGESKILLNNQMLGLPERVTLYMMDWRLISIP